MACTVAAALSNRTASAAYNAIVAIIALLFQKLQKSNCRPRHGGFDSWLSNLDFSGRILRLRWLAATLFWLTVPRSE